jgi:glycosyltransferase involved in cell wall biosynthesis
MKYMDDYALIELSNENKSLKSVYPNKYFSFSKDNSLIGYFLSFFRFISFINREKPDIINPQDHIALLFVLASSYIPFVHKPKHYFYTKFDPKKKGYFFYDWLQQSYFNKCAGVFCISGSTRDSMLPYHKANFIVIPCGLDLPYIKKQNMPKQDRFVLFFGRLVRKKGIDILLEAFNRSSVSKTHLLVMFGPEGDQDLLAKVKTNPNTEHLGIVSETRKQELLNSASIVVLPSMVEGFGYTVLEALYYRENPKTVIISDIPVFKEFFGDFTTNFKSGDVLDLASKLDFVNSQFGKYKPDKAFRSIFIKFSGSNMVARYADAYSKLSEMPQNKLL